MNQHHLHGHNCVIVRVAKNNNISRVHFPSVMNLRSDNEHLLEVEQVVHNKTQQYAIIHWNYLSYTMRCLTFCIIRWFLSQTSKQSVHFLISCMLPAFELPLVLWSLFYVLGFVALDKSSKLVILDYWSLE